MSKKNRNDLDDDEWGNCPVCDRSVKTKNLDRHVKKMHSDISDRELRKRMKNGSSGMKKADMRKELVAEKKRRDIVMTIVGLFIISAIIVGLFYIVQLPGMNNSSGVRDEPEPVEDTPEPTVENEVRIPVDDVDDGKAHYYSYKSGGVTIRYFVLKSSDGVIRAAFDACDVCYEAKKGYHQSGDEMVCNNCGLTFPSNKINEEKGGCNPAPLDRTVDGDEVVINIDDIKGGKWYFQ